MASIMRAPALVLRCRVRAMALDDVVVQSALTCACVVKSSARPDLLPRRSLQVWASVQRTKSWGLRMEGRSTGARSAGTSAKSTSKGPMEMTANGGALQSARIEARVDADGEEGKAAPAPTESKTPDQAAKTAPTPSSHEFLPSTSADPSAPSSPTPPPLHQRLGLLTTLINSYSRTQKRRSLLTNFFAAVITYFIGDLAAQRLGGWGSPDGEDYDAQRTLRNVVIGGAVSPFAYKWFLYLSLNFNAFSSKALNILLKVAINQAVFTPLFLTYYFAANALLSGATPGETVERVRRTVPTGMWNALKLWPAVTAVNLWAVPLEFRAVFAGVVAVGWQGYLSWLNRRAERGRKIREGVEMKAQE